jgi:urate oxidase
VIELGPNRYGKSAIRVVRLVRGPERHRIRDLTVAIALEGDFEAAHVHGDNALVVATDTMKNTAYAFAAEHLGDDPIESYGRALAEHFVSFDQVDRAIVDIHEHPWRPVELPTGDPAPDAFERPGVEVRTARVSASAEELVVEAGIKGLTVMKSTRSAFVGFPRDRYTTLAESTDRIMATEVAATWRYVATAIDARSDTRSDARSDARSDTRSDTRFDADAEHAAIRSTLLGTFADHDSPSVQGSVWVIGRAILERHESVDEIRLTMPNLHHWLVDLTPFGLENRGEVFVATREPHGLIDATVRRSDLPR